MAVSAFVPIAASGGCESGFVGAFHQAGFAPRCLIFVDDAALGGLVNGFAGETNGFRAGGNVTRAARPWQRALF